MKIEYIKDGDPENCPLIRIYGNETKSFKNLKNAILQLAKAEVSEVAIHSLPNFSGVNECELIAKLGENTGIKQIEANKFECTLDKLGWHNIEGLLEPFCKTIDGFQWLDETGKIKLLVSTDGYW